MSAETALHIVRVAGSILMPVVEGARGRWRMGR